MNKKNLIIEIILGLIIIWVVINQYTMPTRETEKNDKEKTEEQQTTGLKVAYINTDSLIANYKLAQELNKQFSREQKQSEKELEKRMRKFEKNYKAFQEKVQRGGFLTQSSAKAQQQELLAEQQELQKLQQQLQNGLMAKEQGIYQQLYDSISNYVAEYNKKHNYDLILSNTMAGTIMYGKQKFNITSVILNKLNRRYKRKNQE